MGAVLEIRPVNASDNQKESETPEWRGRILEYCQLKNQKLDLDSE